MAFCFHKTKIIIKNISILFTFNKANNNNHHHHHVKQGYSTNTIYIKGIQSV